MSCTELVCLRCGRSPAHECDRLGSEMLLYVFKRHLSVDKYIHRDTLPVHFEAWQNAPPHGTCHAKTPFGGPGAVRQAPRTDRVSDATEFRGRKLFRRHAHAGQPVRTHTHRNRQQRGNTPSHQCESRTWRTRHTYRQWNYRCSSSVPSGPHPGGATSSRRYITPSSSTDGGSDKAASRQP